MTETDRAHPGPRDLHEVILANMAEGVCLVRAADGVIVYANTRFEKMLGYGPGELVGRPVSIVNFERPGATAEQIARRILERLSRCDEAEYEIENVRKDGTPFWSRARTVSFRHPDFGDVWVAVHQDVTAERAAVQRLREQEKLLSTVIDALPVGLWITDAAGNIVRGNAAGQKIWEGARYVGVEHYGEYLGWWADSGQPIAPEDWALARAVRSGETSIGEQVRIRCFDGSFKTILNSATPLRDESGAILGAVVVNQDISELKRLEQEQTLLLQASAVLSQSLDYDTTLQRIARIAVPALADGCVVWVDRSGSAIEPAVVYGTDPERAAGFEECLRRYPEEGAARSAARVKRTGEAELVTDLGSRDLALIAPTAEHRSRLRAIALSSYLVVPLQGRHGPVGALLLFTAAGRQLSADALGTVGELGSRAGSALDNARLFLAAQRATRSRDDLLAVVAHDLRNPLGTVMLKATLLQMQLRDTAPDAVRSLGAVTRAALQMKRLIDDLLDLERIDHGIIHLTRQPVSVESMIREIREILAPLATQTRLEIDVAPGLPDVAADRDRVIQILSNLAGNALKFTPAGGQVTIGAAAGATMVKLWVRDTGPGIPAEQLPHLFDRHWQSDPADRRGVGLGLAIAHGLVRAHGGEIWVESRPGAGSTFWFTLPAAPRDAAHPIASPAEGGS